MSNALRVAVLGALAALSTAIVAGCASEVEAPADGDEDVAEDDLSAAGKALIGSWSDDSGTLRGLVLTSESVGQQNTFFAYYDTGIRCAAAPCPSGGRVQGTFSGGAKTITLRSPDTNPHAQRVLGTYRYVRNGDKLTLTRKGESQSLGRQDTYCQERSDCYLQDYIHPACLGQASCGSGGTCGWRCGVRPPPP